MAKYSLQTRSKGKEEEVLGTFVIIPLSWLGHITPEPRLTLTKQQLMFRKFLCRDNIRLSRLRSLEGLILLFSIKNEWNF
jgi:hypothetical protein